MEGPPQDSIGDFRDPRRDADALGVPTARYPAGAANLVAGVILAFLALGAAGALAVFLVRQGNLVGWSMPLAAEREPSWLLFFVFGLISLVLSAVGVFLLRFVLFASGSTVYFCPGGFYRESSRGVEVFPWKEIATVTETILSQHVPVLNWPANLLLPIRTNRTFHVVRVDGVAILLDGNGVKDIDDLGHAIRDAARPLGVEWKLIELRD